MKLYHEYALTPEKRTGLMVPRSALPDIFTRPDSGYCTVYAFDQAATFAIRAQGNAQGMGRFPVYSDRLWIDIDDDNVENARVRARDVAAHFKSIGAAFTVWFSGGKGYHICVKITPMFGKDVPYSQRCYVEAAGIKCDYSLYQHGRLFSNPGRRHPKTGIKKHKVMDHAGETITIPMLEAPIKDIPDRDTLTNADLARVVYARMGSYIMDAPLPGMRHTTLWSIAMAAFEAGMTRDAIYANLSFVNKLSPQPKSDEELWRAIDQAQQQSGIQTSPNG